MGQRRRNRPRRSSGGRARKRMAATIPCVPARVLQRGGRARHGGARGGLGSARGGRRRRRARRQQRRQELNSPLGLGFLGGAVSSGGGRRSKAHGGASYRRKGGRSREQGEEDTATAGHGGTVPCTVATGTVEFSGKPPAPLFYFLPFKFLKQQLLSI